MAKPYVIDMCKVNRENKTEVFILIFQNDSHADKNIKSLLGVTAVKVSLVIDLVLLPFPGPFSLVLRLYSLLVV